MVKLTFKGSNMRRGDKNEKKMLEERIIRARTLIMEAISGVYTKPTAHAINSAIDNHWAAIIRYNSKGEGKHLRSRVIVPVAFGLSKAGNPVVRAYQVSRTDTTTKAPAWKFFRVDRILGWKNMKDSSIDTKKLEGFNSTGDMTMSKVFNISTLGRVKSVKKIGGGTKPADISYTPITKDTIDQTPAQQKEPKRGNEMQRMNADDIVNDILNNMDNRQSPEEKTSINIDNHDENDYSSEKDDNVSRMRNADTEPVSKDEIEGRDEGNEDEETADEKTNANAEKMKADNQPYTKDMFVNDYNNMLKRMDKALKGENFDEES